MAPMQWTVPWIGIVVVLSGCSGPDVGVDDSQSTSSGDTDAGTGTSSIDDGSGSTTGGAPEDPDTGSSGGVDDGCMPAPDAVSADWYVAPDGSPEAAGTQDDPLDLATVLAAEGPVQPGERVMVLEGTYVGRYLSQVSGEPEAAVVVFAEPGARVTIDGNAAGSGSALSIEGPWVEVHGFEFTNSDEGRVSKDPGSSPSDISLVDGVTITAPNVKLINNVIHDTAQGVSFWSGAVDGELYGNIIYNNGWIAPDRGHGHAIYTQNAEGTKRIARNVLFFGFSFGVHAYTEGGSIQGFDIVENVWFRTGASVPGQTGYTDGCLVGGLQPVARTVLDGNASFAPGVGERGVLLGWGGAVENEDITLTDNFFVGRLGFQGNWQQGTVTGNTVHGELSGIERAAFPANTFSDELPEGQEVIVRENDYDPRRAELVVYDWAESGAVAVDLEGVVPVGASFEVHSVFDLWGAPVVSGVFEGGAVDVPLGTKPAPEPRGLEGAIVGEDDPGARFGVFVVRHEPCAEG